MQSRVEKLEAVMATLATREDLARLEVKLHQEISGIHQDLTYIHRAVNAQTSKILLTLIYTSTLLVSVTYYFAKNAG
jgi:hypothetical protein